MFSNVFVVALILLSAIDATEQLIESDVSFDSSSTLVLDEKPRYKLNTRFTSEQHRSVQPLEEAFRASTSMNAKFR